MKVATPKLGDRRFDLPDDVADAVQRGRLEQTCRWCGRWEAAHWHCSWCTSPTGPDDWYANGDASERQSRLPTSPPASVPPEYRDVRAWPATWGLCPYAAPRLPQTPLMRPRKVELGHLATVAA